MFCIRMSNDESLIYVFVSLVFHILHFRQFGDMKMRLLLIRQRVLLSHDFGYTCIGIRIICKYQHFHIVNSDYYCSNTRIPHLMSYISMK